MKQIHKFEQFTDFEGSHDSSITRVTLVNPKDAVFPSDYVTLKDGRIIHVSHDEAERLIHEVP